MVLRRLRRWLLLRDPEIRYIVNVGVDDIPEVEDPLGPSASIFGAAGKNIERASRFLDSDDALKYFIHGMEEKIEYTVSFFGGMGGVVLLLANSPRKLEGPWFMLVDSDEGWIARLLVYNSVITGAQVHTPSGTLHGRMALEVIETAGGQARIVALKLKRRLAEWDPGRLSVYVRGIDRQHQFLVANLNILYLGLVSGEDADALEKVLDNLVDYTKFHFRSEEVLMDRFNAPLSHASMHKRQHKEFTKRVTGFLEKYKAGEADLTLDVLSFLANWLQGHIAGTDRRFGRWLKYEAKAPIAD